MAWGSMGDLAGAGRKALVATMLATAAFSADMFMGVPAFAQAQSYAIPAGPLAGALAAFGRQSGTQIAYEASIARGKTSPGLSGTASREEAIARLLAGTGLRYSFTDPSSILITLAAGDVGGLPADGATPLERITVDGDGETAWGPVDGFVATRSASGTKTDTPLVEIPQSISVVTRDQIEKQGAKRLEDALTYTPGVSVGSYGFNPEQDYVFMRGFQVPFFLDGTRQYRDYIVGAQLGVEPYGLERIETVRGPASVLYGQIAPGGIVNQVIKRPTADPFNEVQLTLGDPRRLQAAFDVGGPIDDEGTFLYRLTGLGRSADGQMDFQGDDRLFIAPALTWSPDAETTLTVFGQLQRDKDALRPVPLPAFGTIFDSVHGTIPRDRFLGEPGFDSFDRTQYSLGYEFEHHFNDTWSIRQNLRYSHVDQTENYTLTAFDYGSFVTDGRTVDRTGWNDVNEIGTLGIDNQLIGEFDTGGLAHKLILGLDYSRSRSDWKFASATLAPIDAFDPVYGTPIGTLVPAISELKTATQIGLYAQDQIAWDNWRLTLGGRYDWAKGTTTDRFAAVSTTQRDHAFTGRVGLTYLFDNGLAPYVSYSTSFEPEIGLDGNGDPFRPTTAQQYEVGIKYQPEGSNSFFTLSVFDLTRQNILTRDLNPPPTNPWAQIQTGEARVRGLEAEARISVTDRFDLVGAYTYLDSEITESNNADLGMPLFLTPKHQFSLWANYTIEDGAAAGLGAGLGMRYRGKVWGSSHEIEVPSYTLFDASLTYDFGIKNPDLAGLDLTVSARNLFDKKYIATCSFWEGCFYGEGRNVTATLKYRW
ncbi:MULTISPECIES: TonB-dependent siderophore receptor [unclassified Shinella]|uniref:TonB-dependent siderophore receptor n=1 Tax=unclassified Shinella TaxID=2643062 RepID=UPI00225DB102|nr:MULTISPECIES: TonB-dependent siderophore receptor [unclassified Shinella]MCO5140155.1 TonB-dependent siderophore receptor [Shinella sp.]MDC7256827.1 TonB-dependent siderophore receptor [Shinella sp. YE25]CAI0339711.1 Ferrichrome-iron receptor [Rhizobiaceae bacterium]CAK7258103.1 iron complex outermembrane recepter protein [Shinella sp. WSC3-e]